MDARSGLSATDAIETRSLLDVLCPRCARPASGPASVTLHRPFPVDLCRCTGCAGLYSRGPGPPRAWAACDRCRIPHPVEAGGDEAVGGATCPECARGRNPVELGVPALVVAAEEALRGGIERRHRIVGEPALNGYLDTLAERVAVSVPVPGRLRLALLDERAELSIAFPSGLVVWSLGLLVSVRDEAELVFLLAHDAAHIAAGDSADLLTSVALPAMAAVGNAVDAWDAAVGDLAALGAGDANEGAADRSAIETVRRLGYDAQAAIAWLERFERRSARPGGGTGRLFLAHPPAARRIAALRDATRDDTVARSAAGRSAARLNREVFRRVVRPEELASRVRELAGLAARPATDSAARGERRVVWLALLAALLLAVLFLVRF